MNILIKLLIINNNLSISLENTKYKFFLNKRNNLRELQKIIVNHSFNYRI